MQPQQAPLIFVESERPVGERLLKLALETDRVEGYTEPHAVMIARLAETIGRQMGLHGQDLSALKFAALAHDFGERGMKRNYMLSPDALSWEETLDLWRHPILGEQAAADLHMSRQSQLFVRWHHEWWNGQGYPDGLAGTAIPLGARILRAVDSYCALISRRPHREAYELIEAEQLIADMAGIEFDPQIVKLLLALVIEERKQREAETWSVESEPDLQYVSPGEESYEATSGVISQTEYTEAEEELYEVNSETDAAQSSDSIAERVDPALSVAVQTDASLDSMATTKLNDVADSAEELMPVETPDQAELEQAPTSELIPQEQISDNLQEVRPIETGELDIEDETEAAPKVQS